MRIIFPLLLALASIKTSASPKDVLKYEPAVVTLRGTLARQDFAGPPHYESVARGDKLERPWILILKGPIDVIAAPNDELFETHKDVKEVQLVCLQDCDKRFSFSVGKDVVLAGTLFSAHTGHHHKDVLMNVQATKR